MILVNYMCDTVSAKLSQPICMNASIKPLWTSSDSFFSLENTLLILEAIQMRQAGDKVIFPNILITSQSCTLCQVHRVQQWFELVCLFHSVTYTVTWKICECVPQPQWCMQSCVRSIEKEKKSLYWNTQKSQKRYSVFTESSESKMPQIHSSARITELRTTTAVWSK